MSLKKSQKTVAEQGSETEKKIVDQTMEWKEDVSVGLPTILKMEEGEELEAQFVSIVNPKYLVDDNTNQPQKFYLLFDPDENEFCLLGESYQLQRLDKRKEGDDVKIHYIEKIKHGNKTLKRFRIFHREGIPTWTISREKDQSWTDWLNAIYDSIKSKSDE